jgi:predicted GNAT family N-acyltransferase
MSNFVTHVAPMGTALLSFNRSLSATEQSKPNSIPQAFMDAMAVREVVFVDEQHVPWDRELDSEDANCHHFVAYANVAVKTKKAIPLDQPLPPGAEGSPDTAPSSSRPRSSGRPRSSTDASRRRSSADGASPSIEGGMNKPVGTIRIVPPEGVVAPASRRSSSTAGLVTSPVQETLPPPADDNPTPHPTLYPNEPYIRLGRLATLPEFRGMGLSRLLINTALDYARKNPRQFSPVIDVTEIAAAIQEGVPTPEPWKGLIVVHAQKWRTDALWQKYGFQLDRGMGEWMEEGIMHVGMCLKVDVNSWAKS